MTGELEAIVRQFFAALDHKDFTGVLQFLAEEVQAVDEIARRWLRGRAALAGYLRQLEATVQGLRSVLSDVQEQVWGDSGLVTGWLEQTYLLAGQPQHIAAPLSVGFQRAGGAWQIILLHSVPLSDTSSP